jgi:nitroimidazol reductase NimA-like FMN-containing flavoprotein (pyridoxamine 5'-phosphate oxidase superfamily)
VFFYEIDKRFMTMLNRIKAILGENSLCVLATCSENRPHCSLMAYLYDIRENILYMMTLRTTQKYRNIRQNPWVSVMVDTRSHDCGRDNIQALTVSGYCSLLVGAPIRSDIISRMVDRHPHLLELSNHADLEVLIIHSTAFLLMDGAMKSHYFLLEDNEARFVNT